MWHLDFVWGLKGIERYIADHADILLKTMIAATLKQKKT